MAWRPPGITEIGRLGSGATGRVASGVHKGTGMDGAGRGLADRTRLGTGPRARGSRPTVAPGGWAGGRPHRPSAISAAPARFLHALEGRPPYGPGTREAHRTGAIPAVSIPEALRPLVAKGLAKNAD